MRCPGPVRGRVRLGEAGGTALLASVLLLPALVFYAGWATSLALGTSLAALALLAAAMLPRVLRSDVLSSLRILAVVLVFIVIHAALASAFLSFDGIRGFSSLGPLALTILGGSAWARLLSTASTRTLDRIVAHCFVLMLLIAFLPILGLTVPQPGGQHLYVKPLFPFTEPSHFALVFTPLLMHTCVSSSERRRLLMLLMGAGVALTLKNLTLVVGLLLVASACLSRRMLPVVLVSSLAISQMDLSYYIARIDFSGEAQNLSNLVYVQGWQQIGESLSQSSGWGIGFQQLGVQGSSTPASEAIYALAGDYINILDGGFTLAKLASEFGVLGLILIVIYMRATWSAWRALRLASERPGMLPAVDVFASSVIVSYTVELVVRGTGYFTGTAILLCAALTLKYSRRLPQRPGVTTRGILSRSRSANLIRDRIPPH